MKISPVGVIDRARDGTELTTYHLPPSSISDFHTLCAIDAFDSNVGTYGTIDAGKGQKVDCAQCFAIWSAVKKFGATRKDFKGDTW